MAAKGLVWRRLVQHAGGFSRQTHPRGLFAPRTEGTRMLSNFSKEESGRGDGHIPPVNDAKTEDPEMVSAPAGEEKASTALEGAEKTWNAAEGEEKIASASEGKEKASRDAESENKLASAPVSEEKKASESEEKIERYDKKNWRRTCVYVKYIPNKLSRDQLRDHFQIFGKIRLAFIVKREKEARSFKHGIVCFYEEDAAKKAMEVAYGAMMAGRKIKVSRVTDHRLLNKSGYREYPENCILQVHDVPAGATLPELRECLESNDVVPESVFLQETERRMSWTVNQRSQTAHLRFASKSQATEAMKKIIETKVKMGQHALRVNYAYPTVGQRSQLLVVSNLEPSLEAREAEDLVRPLLEGHGTVEHVKPQKAGAAGMRVLVKFSSWREAEEARKALAGHDLNGRNLIVFFPTQEPKYSATSTRCLAVTNLDHRKRAKDVRDELQDLCRARHAVIRCNFSEDMGFLGEPLIGMISMHSAAEAARLKEYLDGITFRGRKLTVNYVDIARGRTVLPRFKEKPNLRKPLDWATGVPPREELVQS